jgi:exopolysaccharide biosynthesis polyprenyl glycosylphosphotransferase
MATISLDSINRHKPFSEKWNSAGAQRRSGTRAGFTARLMMAADVAGILVALALALRFGLERWMDHGVSLRTLVASQTPIHVQLAYLAFFLATLLAVAHHHGLYGASLSYSTLNEQRKAVQSCLTAGLLLCGAMYMLHGVMISRAVVAWLIGLTTIFFCISRAFWRRLVFRRYERGMDTRNVLILGTSTMGIALYKQIIGNGHLGRVFKGFIEMPGCAAQSQAQPSLILGVFHQLRYLSRLHFIDEVIIAESCNATTMLGLVDLAREMGIEVLVVPGFYDGLTPEAATIEYLGNFPVVAVHRRDEKPIASFFKRTVDVVLSSAIVAMLLPALVVIALAVKLGSEGPVFYVSERIGKKGRVFPCLKFRTMIANAEQLKAALAAKNERTGILFKMKDDPRITRVGRILRKYSLDELPQLFNVLRGEMSLVGPRPPLASEVEKYELEHYRRLEVMPGLTGLWQVRARQDPSFERYVALDLAYVENWSFWLDLKILVRTAEVVVRGTGS